MDLLFSLMTPEMFAMACGVALIGGLIKGMVGFALPMILISGLSSFLPPDVALAGLIFATVASNGLQALRGGVAAALQSVRKFRLFLLVGFVFLMASAQMVLLMPRNVMLLALGVPVTFFAALQLIGFRLRLDHAPRWVEALFGAIAGSIGGFSGVWGPPTVLYLTARNTPKTEQHRVQGVIYGLGAVSLVFAHTGSGVLRAETVPLSVALLGPALLGMWLGMKVHDRIDQETFRKATLLVLMVAGMNLVRLGLTS
jgi:uncharacterized membrane protein YfcA